MTEQTKIAKQDWEAICNRSYNILDISKHVVRDTGLVQLLALTGITIRGLEPQRKLNTYLKRDQRFKQFDKGKWGLADWGFPY